MPNTKEYSPLMDEGDYLRLSPKHSSNKKTLLVVLLLGVPLIFSTCLNLFLLLKGLNIENSSQSGSKWAHLIRNVTKPIYRSTQYGPDVSSPDELDKLWQQLDVSPGIIRLSDEYAKENGLPLSPKISMGSITRSLFLGRISPNALFETNIRMVNAQKKGTETVVAYHHVLHCLDTLLQDVMCHADDTPWYELPPAPYREKYARFQSRQCKDWGALLKWSEENSACYHYTVMGEDGRPKAAHPFEHYQFCPKGSPFTPTMEQYFEEHDLKFEKPRH